MIRGIYQGGRYMQVSGGSPSTPAIYQNYSSGQSSGPQNFAGQVRYNIGTQSMEVFDGNMWQSWNNSTATVGLTVEAESLLDWAREKRQEEINLRMRMEKHPGLKDAYEKFKIMDALTLEEEKHGNQTETPSFMQAP
jgi:hypothetical protein